MKSRAIVFSGPYKVTIDEFAINDLQRGQILTKTLLSGVSTGTENRVLSGKQEGAIYPLIPGYENLGEVVETGNSTALKKGQKVFVGQSDFTGPFNKSWGAHLEYAISDAGSVVPVPQGLDDEKAVFTKIGAIALHGVKRAEIAGNENVVVVGLGIIGTMAALCAKAFGANVIGVDTDDERLKYLSGVIDQTINPLDKDLRKMVMDFTAKGADVVIDATGIPELADQNARLLKSKEWDNLYHPSGRFILLGSYTHNVAFNYNDTLFMNEINILASRDTVHQDLVDMLNLINTGKVDVSIIPQNIIHYKNAPEAYEKLIKEKPLRMAFDWRLE